MELSFTALIHRQQEVKTFRYAFPDKRGVGKIGMSGIATYIRCFQGSRDSRLIRILRENCGAFCASRVFMKSPRETAGIDDIFEHPSIPENFRRGFSPTPVEIKYPYGT